MLNQIHFAAQYPAMAGKSFLEQRADDSHTNLGFNIKTRSFETWALNGKQLKLLFDLPNFQLKWSTGESFALDGKTHAQVLNWLQLSSKQVGLVNDYIFDLHYELPFDWSGSFLFELSNTPLLKKLIELRKLASTTLNAFLQVENLSSDVRVWPHHFDTGAFVVLEDGSGKSIGLGMAIPDSIIDDHYFYINGYKGHSALEIDAFKNLSFGEWKNKGFTGAVLPASNITKEQAVQFFQEAFSQYQNQ